jgi:hypothetical protein
MLGGLEQQVAAEPFPIEVVVAVIGVIGTIVAAWIVSKKR